MGINQAGTTIVFPESQNPKEETKMFCSKSMNEKKAKRKTSFIVILYLTFKKNHHTVLHNDDQGELPTLEWCGFLLDNNKNVEGESV